MDHARCETANGGEFLCAGDGAICLHPIRDFLANSDDVTDFAGVVGPHRNLTDDPVSDIAFGRWSLLIDAFDLATFKYPCELFLQHIAGLSREDFKNILAEH